jgi:hypothetical protein
VKPSTDHYLQLIIDLTGLVILLVIFGGLVIVGIAA